MLFATPHILIFVALLLMHYGVDGVQITGLSPRRGPDHGGGDDPAPTTSSPSSINTSPIISSPLPSHTSSTSDTHTTSTSPSSTSPSLSSITPSPSSITPSLSSSASSLATSTSNSEDRSAELRRIGTIVGTVLGSVILASLCLMTIAHFRRRARIARKQPRGSSYFTEPTTEMSQTRNGPPLTSSAPLVHRPAPMHFFNGSSTNNTSSSPLLPAATFHGSLDAIGPFRRPLSTSEFDGNSDVPSDTSQSPFDTHPVLSSSLDSSRLERAVSARPSSSISGQFLPHDLSLDTFLLQRADPAGPALSSTSGQLSPLHRDMAGFQKTLEADHKRDISDQSQTIISDPISDPPPKYTG